MRRDTAVRGLSWRKITARVAAGGLLAAAGVTAFTGVALADSSSTGVSAAKPPGAGAGGGGAGGGGNIGAVKVNSVALGNGNATEPHLTCPISVEWDGFPANSQYAVGFVAVNPSSGSIAVSGDPASGTLVTDPTAHTYSLAFTGTPNNKGEFHVAVNVTTTTPTLTTDNKQKTFWAGNCASSPAATGGTVDVSGVCTTSNDVNSTYTWTATATPTAGATSKVASGSWTVSGVSHNFQTDATTGTSTFVTQPGENTVSVKITAPWTLGSLTPAPASCGTAAGLSPLGLSAQCTGPNSGVAQWSVTNPNAATTVQNLTVSGASGASSLSSTTLTTGTVTFTTPAPQAGAVTVSGDVAGQPVSSPAVSFAQDCTTSGGGNNGGGGGNNGGGGGNNGGGGGNNGGGGTTPPPVTGHADPKVSASKACKTGISVVLNNMDGTAGTTFTVTKPDGSTVSVPVRAGQIVRSSYAVKEDTTGTVTVSAPGMPDKTVTYQKNCTQVLGEKVVKTPKTSKPSKVLGEKVSRLPFTGDNTRRELLVGASLMMIGALLCGLAGRRREDLTA